MECSASKRLLSISDDTSPSPQLIHDGLEGIVRTRGVIPHKMTIHLRENEAVKIQLMRDVTTAVSPASACPAWRPVDGKSLTEECPSESQPVKSRAILK